MVLTNSKELRTSWIDFLASANNRYFLTIAFPKNTPHSKTKELAEKLLRHLNRTIFKKRFDDGKSFIEGYAIRESTPSMHTDHYHIIIHHNDYLPGFDRLKHLIDKEIERFKSGYKKNYIKDYDLQEYFNNNNANWLEKYVTKNFYNINVSAAEAMDSIAPLSANGMESGREYFNH